MATLADPDEINTNDYINQAIDTSIAVSYSLDSVIDSFGSYLQDKDLQQRIPAFTSSLVSEQIKTGILYACFECPDQRNDDKKGDQTFDVNSESTLVYEYLQDDEPKQPAIDMY